MDLAVYVLDVLNLLVHDAHLFPGLLIGRHLEEFPTGLVAAADVASSVGHDLLLRDGVLETERLFGPSGGVCEWLGVVGLQDALVASLHGEVGGEDD